MKSEFQILCSGSFFFLLFLFGGWGWRVGGLPTCYYGHWGNPSSEQVIFFNKNKKKLPLTRWSLKALVRNFLVHFGGFRFSFYTSCLRMVKESSWVRNILKTWGRTLLPPCPRPLLILRNHTPPWHFYPGPLVFKKFWGVVCLCSSEHIFLLVL
jgi:hypothetical protein